MKKLRQYYLGYISLLFLLSSNVGWGQIDINTYDAYFKVTDNNEIINSNYLIVNQAGTRAVNNSLPTRLFDVDVLGSNSVTKQYLDGKEFFTHTTGNNAIKWTLQNRGGSIFSIFNTGNQSYLINDYVDAWIFGHYVNYGWSNTFNQNNSNHKWTVYHNSIRSNYTSHAKQYMRFDGNNVTLVNSSSDVILYRQMKLDELQNKTVNQGSSEILPSNSETGGTITYELANHSDINGNANINNTTRRVSYTKIGTVDIIATVAAHNNVPSYKKRITVTIINPQTTCFNEGFDNNVGSEINYFTSNHKFSLVTGNIKIGQSNSKIFLNTATKIRTEKLNNIIGTVKVEYRVTGRTANNSTDPKIIIGFVDDNNNFLRPAQTQVVNKSTANLGCDWRGKNCNYDAFPTINGDYRDYEYIFTNVPLNSRLLIESPNSNSNKLFIEHIKIQCTPANVTIWEQNTWSDGVPTINSKAILRQDINTDVIARELVVEKGNIIIKEGNYLRVAEKLDIKPESTLTFEKGAYLLLDENATVTGNASFKTNVDYFRYDTHMFASPVGIHQIKGDINAGAFSDNNVRVFTFSPSTNSWIDHNSNNFNLGIGLGLQRQNGNKYMSTNTTNTPTLFDSKFYGTPNNSNPQITLSPVESSGSYNLGNPYTTPLSITRFLNENSTALQAVRIWKNDNHWDFAVGNYTSSDYWINCTLSGCDNNLNIDKIDVGVGFVGVLSANPPANPVIKFNHSQKSYDMTKIFENQRIQNGKSRYILSLHKENLHLNSVLVSYIDGATNNFDHLYDYKVLESKPNQFVILSNQNHYLIEGKEFPLNIDDEVKYSLKLLESGNYKITLDDFDGVFDEVEGLFLKDLYTNEIIDLFLTPEYSFESEAGEFIDRFVVVYKGQRTLGVSTQEYEQDIIVYKSENELFARSKNNIKSLTIYNSNGFKLEHKNLIKSREVQIIKNYPRGIYYVSFELEDGQKINKKIIK